MTELKDNASNMDDASTNAGLNASIAGFPALAIERIRGAQKLNRMTIWLVMLAIIIFIILGTMASLKAFHLNAGVANLFHKAPYVAVAIAIPLILYQAFIVARYRLCQPSMLIISIGGGLLLLVICLIFSLSSWLWLAMTIWIGVAYWFQATFKRFFTFIDTQG